MIERLMELRSTIALILAILLFAMTLVMRYVFDLWWPWGIAMATILGFFSLFNSFSGK